MFLSENSNYRITREFSKRLFVLALMIVTGISVFLVSMTRSLAMPLRQSDRSYELFERDFPKGVIEITQVRNLNSSAFPDTLEVEVKNTSSKPIYGIQVLVLLPDSRTYSEKNAPLGMQLFYGDRRFISLKRLATSDDIPLGQGETTVLKSDPDKVRRLKERLKQLPESVSSRVVIAIQAINFGDGTGYTGKVYNVGR